MPHDLQTLGTVQGDGGDGAILCERKVQVRGFPIDPGRHHLMIGGYVQSFKGLSDRSPLLQIDSGAVIQGDFYHYCLNKKGISGLSRSFPDAVNFNYVTYKSNSKGWQSRSLITES
jgi:hypothetical protein